jgi:hypothetical protein
LIIPLLKKAKIGYTGYMNKYKSFIIFYTLSVFTFASAQSWYITPTQTSNNNSFYDSYSNNVNQNVWYTGSNTNQGVSGSSNVTIPTTNASGAGTSNNSSPNNNTSSSVNYTIANDSNRNGVRDSADQVINSMTSTYLFSASQKSAVEQIARSYEYILLLAPANPQSAYQANLRELSSIRCAEERLPASLLDVITVRVEQSIIASNNEQIVYERYINLLTENNEPPASTITSCEDIYSSTTNNNPNNNSNSNSNNTNNNSNNQSNNPSLPCLVLNEFMTVGSSGVQVIQLQTFLVMSGYMNVWPTGYFSVNTANALRNFQNKYDIDSRFAWAGPSTRSRIASITCNGDQNAMSRAYNGYTPKKNYTNGVANNANRVQVVQGLIPEDKPVITKQIENKPVENVTETIEADNSMLSISSGTFDLTRTKTNVLYFTAAAPVSGDRLYICFEKSGTNSCTGQENYSNYSVVKSKYDPNNYDSIANIDKWIFNLYYNQNTWGSTGGKIYFKLGLDAIPAIYTVNVKN